MTLNKARMMRFACNARSGTALVRHRTVRLAFAPPIATVDLLVGGVVRSDQPPTGDRCSKDPNCQPKRKSHPKPSKPQAAHLEVIQLDLRDGLRRQPLASSVVVLGHIQREPVWSANV
jgi:hypothetical protein